MKPKLFLCLALVLSGYCRAAIVYSQAPANGQQIVIKYLTGDFKPKGPLDFLGVSRVEDLTICSPYQSYAVGLTNLAAGRLLSDAKPSADYWIYPLLCGSNVVGLASVKVDEKTGTALKCVALDQARRAEGIVTALRIAEQLPQTKNQSYEVRALEMPWILFRAVWLHSKTDDIIIPLPDHWERWKAYQPCSESEMVKILRPIAEKELKVEMMPGMVGP
jgi:hypothetical protein